MNVLGDRGLAFRQSYGLIMSAIFPRTLYIRRIDHSIRDPVFSEIYLKKKEKKSAWPILINKAGLPRLETAIDNVYLRNTLSIWLANSNYLSCTATVHHVVATCQKYVHLTSVFINIKIINTIF